MEIGWKLIILVALVGLFIAFGVYRQSLGFDQGLAIIDQHSEELLEKERLEKGDPKVYFSESVETTYGHLARQYGYLTLLFTSLLVSAFVLGIKRVRDVGVRILCHLVFILAISASFYLIRIMIRDKLLFADEPYWNNERWSLVRESAIADWLILGLLLAITVVYAITWFKRIRLN